MVPRGFNYTECIVISFQKTSYKVSLTDDNNCPFIILRQTQQVDAWNNKVDKNLGFFVDLELKLFFCYSAILHFATCIQS